MKKEGSQSSSISLRPQCGTIAYKIRPSQAVIPDHSGLYLRISFVLGDDPKLRMTKFESQSGFRLSGSKVK